MSAGIYAPRRRFTATASILVGLQLALFVFSWLTTSPGVSGIASNWFLNSIVIVLDLLLSPVCIVFLILAAMKERPAGQICGVIGASVFVLEAIFVVTLVSMNN